MGGVAPAGIRSSSAASRSDSSSRAKFMSVSSANSTLIVA
jgi:hypothetical protein